MLERRDINLMAPAGSYESLRAAINAGANSVYFGAGKLNMRSRSSVNFSLEDLENIVNICREHDVASYLTLNVALFDSEIEDMQRILDKCKKAGVTAVIASDQAVINYAHSIELDVHISTQLSISNIESLKFYSKYASVVVLARELNLGQVKKIYRQICEQNICGVKGKPIQIEMFCHGALCMATSGKCYMSLHESNHSANRGECFQICRRSYTATDNETGAQLEIDNEYIMSPKDLCTVEFLDQMLNAGVRIFKIEGRARPPEYVKCVCENYNRAINAVLENNYTDELKQELKNNLKTVFNRGFWNGYYLGERLGQWSTVHGSEATQHKEYVAKVTNFYDNLSVAELLMESGELSINDKVVFIGQTTGVVECTIEELRIGSGEKVKRVFKEQIFSLKTPQKIRRGDKLYKLVSN